MSYSVTYDEYKEQLELKKEITEVLKEARTKLLYAQAKGHAGSDLNRSDLPLISDPTDVLSTIIKIESLINKLNLDK